jgi:hypothetical protein
MFTSSVFLYFAFLVLLCFSFLMGYLLFRFYYKPLNFLNYPEDNIYISIALKTVVGAVLLISFFSIYATIFHTVNIIGLSSILLAPLLNLFNNNKSISNKKTENKVSLKEVGILFGFVTLIFCYHIFLTRFTGDFIYYSKLSSAIFTTGIENTSSLYYSYAGIEGIRLYHFGEIWFNSIVIHVFNIHELDALLFITYPFFHVLAFVSLFGIAKTHFKSFFISAVITIALIYGVSVQKLQYLFMVQNDVTWTFGLPSSCSSKIIMIYPFLFLSFFFLYYKRNIIAFSLFTSLCFVLYVTTIIPLVGAIIVLIMFLFFNNRLKIIGNEKLNILPFTFTVFVAVSIFVLTYFIGAKSDGGGLKHLIPGVNTLLDDIWVYIKSLVSYLLIPILYYPLIIIGLVYIAIKRKLQYIDAILTIFIALIIFSASAFMTLLGKGIGDSNQALSNILPVIMVIMGFIFLSKLDNKKLLRISIFIFTVFAIVNLTLNMSTKTGMSSKFDEKRNNELSDFDTKLIEFADSHKEKIVWACSSERYWSRWTFNNEMTYNNPLLLSSNTVYPLEIAPLFCSDIDNYCSNRANKNKAPICIFYQNNDTSPDAIIEFLKSFNISYIFIENSKIVPNDFMLKLEPVLIEDNQGLWEIK